MSPDPFCEKVTGGGVPRASGDEPGAGNPETYRQKCSPRERG